MPSHAEIEQALNPHCYAYILDRAPVGAKAPSRLLHYTSPAAAKSILTHRKLWLTGQPSKGDPLEIIWGEDVLRDVAAKVLAAGPFSPLGRMLNDRAATLFGSEREMFVACFTTDEDQWARRDPAGAVFVFDGARLSHHSRVTIESHGMIQVMYDEQAIRASAVRFLSACRAALEPLGPLDEDAEQLAAQYLMDLGGASFFIKDPSKWTWELEWRLVKRKWAAKIVEAPPVRRVELDIADCSSSGFVELAVGPAASAADRAAFEALAQEWPGVAVRQA